MCIYHHRTTSRYIVMHSELMTVAGFTYLYMYKTQNTLYDFMQNVYWTIIPMYWYWISHTSSIIVVVLVVLATRYCYSRKRLYVLKHHAGVRTSHMLIACILKVLLRVLILRTPYTTPQRYFYASFSGTRNSYCSTSQGTTGSYRLPE